MGKQVSIIQFNGKVGNVVGSKGADGKMLLRARPVIMSKSQTEAQIEQRTLFAAVNSAASEIPSAFFDSLVKEAKSKHITPRNLFVSKNVTGSNMLTTAERPWLKNNDTFEPTYQNVIFNEKGFDITTGNPDFTSPLEVRIPITAGFEDKDMIQILLVSPDTKQQILRVHQFTAGETAVTLSNLPGTWSGQTIYIYMQAARAKSSGDTNTVVNYYTQFWSAWNTVSGSVSELIVWSATRYVGTGNVG